MGLIDVLILLLQAYSYIVLIRVLLSWLNPDPYNPFVRFLYDITEPVLQPVREILPQTGMMDFSPLVVFLIIRVLIIILAGF